MEDMVDSSAVLVGVMVFCIKWLDYSVRAVRGQAMRWSLKLLD